MVFANMAKHKELLEMNLSDVFKDKKNNCSRDIKEDFKNYTQ